jgi:hypothetical protein
MGPPEGMEMLFEKEEWKGDVGEEVCWMLEGGRVSQERVRRQDCRRIEKEDAWSGSWVDV